MSLEEQQTADFLGGWGMDRRGVGWLRLHIQAGILPLMP